MLLSRIPICTHIFSRGFRCLGVSLTVAVPGQGCKIRTLIGVNRCLFAHCNYYVLMSILYGPKKAQDQQYRLCLCHPLPLSALAVQLAWHIASFQSSAQLPSQRSLQIDPSCASVVFRHPTARSLLNEPIAVTEILFHSMSPQVRVNFDDQPRTHRKKRRRSYFPWP